MLSDSLETKLKNVNNKTCSDILVIPALIQVGD